MAIKNENTDAMRGFGTFHKEKKEYKSMKKYFLMGISLGDMVCAQYLGDYYEEHKDYKNANKYYLMCENDK